jgi:hypothetical protein
MYIVRIKGKGTIVFRTEIILVLYIVDIFLENVVFPLILKKANNFIVIQNELKSKYVLRYLISWGDKFLISIDESGKL